MLRSRDREREAIDQLLDAARAGRGGALLLQGDPGIGKSALLGYAREGASGMRVLTAIAADAESTLAYAALHQLLRPVLPLAGRLPAPQSRALRVALGAELGDPPDRFLVSLATLTLLSEAGGEQPLLCLLDDVQWADPPTQEVIAFVSRRLETDAVAMVAAMTEGRGHALEAAGIRTLHLAGLASDAACAVLEERSAVALAPVVRDALVQATDGNPLALIELPKVLTADQLSGRRPLPDPLPVGEDLERIFVERVRSTGPASRSALLVSAAAGSASIDVLEQAAQRLGVEDVVSALSEAADVVRVEHSAVAFRHPLIRSAVYQDASPAQRRSAHRALAEALAGQEDGADRRAWHLGQAALAPDEGVARELERSAERALRRAGHAAAVLVLERAADLSPTDRHRGRRLVAAADAAWRAGDEPRCRALLDRAERLGSAEPPLRLRCQYLRGLIELRSGVPADALRILLENAAEAVEVEPDLALRLLSSAGEAGFQAGDPEATEQIRRLMAVLPADPGSDRFLIARLYLSVSPMSAGEAPAGVHHDFARLLELEDPDLLARVGGMTFGLGEYELARRLRTRSVARARILGAAGTLAWALRSLALDEVFRNRYVWAEACAGEGYRLALETGQPNLACQHKAVLAEVAGLRGREEESRRLMEEVLAEAAGRGLQGTVAMVRRAQAELALARGDAQEAIVQLEALWEAPASQRGVAFAAIPDLAEAAARAGRPELVGERLPVYIAWAESSGSSAAAALAARSRALLASGEVADGLYREALRLHPAAERPLDTARSALLYGEHLRRERRRVDARAQLRAALETFASLGTVRWEERARSELRATGERARRRAPGSLERLTQQELQVARVVSQGATNREAAAQLFISPRTVDHHLRSVFGKLGIRSRAELVRAVLDGGLD